MIVLPVSREVLEVLGGLIVALGEFPSFGGRRRERGHERKRLTLGRARTKALSSAKESSHADSR